MCTLTQALCVCVCVCPFGSDNQTVNTPFRVLLDSTEEVTSTRQTHAILLNNPLSAHYLVVPSWKQFIASYYSNWTAITTPLPPSVHLLSMQAQTKDPQTSIGLRLQGIPGVSTPAPVSYVCRAVPCCAVLPSAHLTLSHVVVNVGVFPALPA